MKGDIKNMNGNTELKRLKNTDTDNLNAVDIAKFIAAILIMMIHYGSIFTNEVTYLLILNVVCRYGVPFFFVATGFFLFRKFKFTNEKIEKSKENFKIFLNYEKRICILYLIWSAVYCVLRYYEYCKTAFGQYNFWKDFFVSFISDQTYYHMWYLLSIIFAVPVMYFLLRFIKIKYVCIIAVILYVIEALSYGYTWLPGVDSLLTMMLKTKTVGVAIFRAMPLILIGIVCLKNNLTYKKKVIGLIICAVLNVVEVLAIYLIGNDPGRYSYIFTTLPLAFFLFSTISETKLNCNKKICTYFRKTSTLIYCIHPLVYYFIEPLELPFIFINFIICVIIVLLISFALVWLSEKKLFTFLKFLF